MEVILKSLLLYPDNKKWNLYNSSGYRKYFESKKNLPFNTVVNTLSRIFVKYDQVPSFEILNQALLEAKEVSASKYLCGVILDQSGSYQNSKNEVAPYSDLMGFGTYLENVMNNQKSVELQQMIKQAQISVQTKPIDEVIRDCANASNKLLNEFNSEKSFHTALMYGGDAVQAAKDAYSKILKKKDDDGVAHYDLGFDALKNIKIKSGDLMIIGGYTSQGKSVFLRHLLYRFITYFGMNTYLLTTEMTEEELRNLFILYHANNKDFFPATPFISRADYDEGRLTQEQYNLYFRAAEDFCSNPKFGTLQIEYPSTGISFSEVSERLKVVENDIMPVQVFAVDYLTQLNPLPATSRAQPQVSDYNLMIKDFKSIALTHKNRQGQSAPLIAITPAQISRHAYSDALKNENLYDLSCLAQYSELEKSADIVMTLLISSDMRAQSQCNLQILKNRSGDVPVDAIQLYTDFAVSGAYSELSGSVVSTEEVIDKLSEMTI